MAELGVSKKQTSRARQAFERSADQAGYFESGKDRLVRPGNLGRDSDRKDETKKKKEEKDNGDGGGGGGDDLHPFIKGLLDTLPKPKTEWRIGDRAEWLQAAEQLFKLIYKGGDDGAIAISYTPSNTSDKGKASAAVRASIMADAKNRT